MSKSWKGGGEEEEREKEGREKLMRMWDRCSMQCKLMISQLLEYCELLREISRGLERTPHRLFVGMYIHDALYYPHINQAM